MRTPSDLPRRRPVREFHNPLTGRGRIALVVAVAAIIVIIISAKSVSNFAIDAWWFASVGRGDIFWGVLRTKLLLAAVFTVAFIAIAVVSLTIADRLAPLVHSDGPEDQILDRYHDIVGSRQPIVRAVLAVLFGLIVGLPAASHWQEWLMFRNAKGFGIADPEFGRDVGFYMFRLPFLMFVVGWLFASLFLVTLLTAIAHYVNGGIRLQPGARHITAQVKLHLSVLLAAMALLKAVDYWLQRFELTTSTRGAVDGLSYTEKHAQLPATNLLIVISLLAAVLLIYNVRQKGIALPVISVGLWLIVAIIAGTIYPAIVQRVSVQPSEITKERSAIVNNITATRHAIGIDKVVTKTLTIGDVSKVDINADPVGYRNLRLIDPSIFKATYQNSQGELSYYQFNDVDVDRYQLAGGTEQVTLAARELNTSQLPSTSWVGKHLSYTSGYGLAFAPSSHVNAQGSPQYVDVTGPKNALNLSKPQLYIGDRLGGYAVVDTANPGGEESLDPAKPIYSGADGVVLDSTWRQLAFAISFGEYNLFGSKLVTDSSRVIFNRDVRQRVAKVAPFLKLDADPYPVVYNGRIVWVVDAYTTSGRYPNAQLAANHQLPAGSGLSDSFNYVRNSVKAVVDAYDGTITLYVVDDTDPVLKVWQSAFPNLFTAQAAVPAELRAHFKYPEDLFRVQTNMYGRYQLSDPGDFYSQQKAWSVAQEPPIEQKTTANQTDSQVTDTTSANSSRVTDVNSVPRFDPYYTMFQAPGASTSEFVLLRPFTPFSTNNSRKELQAFVTAASDPSDYGALTVYSIQKDAAGALPDGPLLIDSTIRTAFTRELTLSDSTGTKVRFGDMQLVLTGSGLVWIRPWYLIATGSGTEVATLDAVTATYNKKSAKGPTIEEALAQLFPGVNINLGDRQGSPSTGTGEPGNGSTTPGTGNGTPGAGSAGAEQLLGEAQAAYDAAQVALKAGDLGTYQKKLDEAYQKAAQAASLATNKTITATTTAPAAGSTSTTTPVTTPTTGSA
jgi:uncharacterized protein